MTKDILLTNDGSFTFYSSEFEEAYHSHYGARQEAQLKFVEPCQLREKAKRCDRLCLLDICYGLGYNSAAALEAIWQENPNCHIELIALEIDSRVPQQAIAHHFLDPWPTPIPQSLAQLAIAGSLQTQHLQAQLLIGDGRVTLQQTYQTGFQADAIFLDPFSPPKCPQLWTVEFLALAAQGLKPTGRIATYSCAAAVRTALSLAQLHLGSTMAVGRRSPGTVASFSAEGLSPLSPKEREALQTRAAIPYRDRYLQASRAEIVQQRYTEQQHSSLESTSAWKKRWTKKIRESRFPLP